MADNSEDIAISVEHVHKSFKLPHEKTTSIKTAALNILKGKGKRSVSTQRALQDISFTIHKGEFFGIVGRNGSGKSTLLKLLAGIYQPNEGSVRTEGTLVPFIELGVGFNPELTGRENVYLNAAMFGFSKKRTDNMYSSIVKFAELEDFMDQKLKNYSSGMQVRLAFSMAIRAKADILIIDEVLAVGDASFQKKCYEYFKRLKRSKQTVVFVSHDMGAVQQYCDRALLIDDSRVVEMGDPRKISTMYSKLFLNKEVSDTKNLLSTELSISGEERWGDGQASWTSVRVVETGTDKDGELKGFDVIAEGKARVDMSYPIFGFSVKNSEFLQLLGTNTVRRGEKIPPLKAGETFTVKWHVPNILNDGMHYVDCTVAHDEATFVSDRWPDAAQIRVGRIETNPYPVYAKNVSFKYERRK